jgi:hypothetical protein
MFQSVATMDMAIEGSRPLQNVVVCHKSKVLVNVGKLQAERYGLRVHVAKNGRDVVTKARSTRADLIVLGNDLKDPTTEETIAMLQADPVLCGTRVVTVKGAIPNLRDILGRYPGPR